MICTAFYMGSIMSKSVSTKLHCYIEIAELQKYGVCVILNKVDTAIRTFLCGNVP